MHSLSLPMSRSLLQPVVTEPEPGVLDERALARAFASFTETAGSLERSYSHLQAEVTRLRQELEASNRDLSQSLEENQRIRLQLNRILEALPCGVLVAASEGTLTMANPEARRLIGPTYRQLPAWIRPLLERAQCSSGELEHQSNIDGIEWIAIRRARLGAEDNGRSLFILQDISARKRLEQEHESLRRRQALAEMSAVLAHEIRNPLGSLELFTGLLAGSKLEPEPRQWVEHLRAGLRTLAATVNNVLEFHSQPPPKLAPTDVGRLLQSLHDFLRPLAQQAGVRMELIHQLDGVLVAADKHRLEQVLLNLALNAFRFMKGGGVLTVSGSVTEAPSPQVRIEIADSGPGIASENLGHIFEPGFTTRPGSPGLGLTVCKTIVEQHDGSIGVRSSAGEGATFHLEFPVLGASQ
jgi:two-component system sensor histidine kinase FlrB